MSFAQADRKRVGTESGAPTGSGYVQSESHVEKARRAQSEKRKEGPYEELEQVRLDSEAKRISEATAIDKPGISSKLHLLSSPLAKATPQVIEAPATLVA